MKGIDRGIRNYAAVCASFIEEQKQELALFCEVYARTPILQEFLKAPHIPLEAKKALLHKVFGERFHKETEKFLQFLLQRGRLEDLSCIMQSVEELSGKKIASLISSSQLDAAQVKQIQSQLDKATGYSYELHTDIDKELIGGFLLKAEHRVYDGTIKNSLAVLKRQLGKAACS